MILDGIEFVISKAGISKGSNIILFRVLKYTLIKSITHNFTVFILPDNFSNMILNSLYYLFNEVLFITAKLIRYYL